MTAGVTEPTDNVSLARSYVFTKYFDLAFRYKVQIERTIYGSPWIAIIVPTSSLVKIIDKSPHERQKTAIHGDPYICPGHLFG